MKIVVIGGSGLNRVKAGSQVAVNVDMKPVAASPNSGVNTVTGEGLAEVLKGAGLSLTFQMLPRGRMRR